MVLQQCDLSPPQMCWLGTSRDTHRRSKDCISWRPDWSPLGFADGCVMMDTSMLSTCGSHRGRCTFVHCLSAPCYSTCLLQLLTPAFPCYQYAIKPTVNAGLSTLESNGFPSCGFKIWEDDLPLIASLDGKCRCDFEMPDTGPKWVPLPVWDTHRRKNI